MGLKEQIDAFSSVAKLKGYRVSSMNYIRDNFDECQRLIKMMKNQGQGSAYKKIAEMCFNDGIKTKDGKMLSTEYINDCLIKIRKEKGVKSTRVVKVKKVDKVEKEKIELTDDVKYLIETGLRSIRRKLSEVLKEYAVNPRNMNLSVEAIQAFKVYLNKNIPDINEFMDGRYTPDDKIDGIRADVIKSFMNYHKKDIYGK